MQQKTPFKHTKADRTSLIILSVNHLRSWLFFLFHSFYNLQMDSVYVKGKLENGEPKNFGVMTNE